MNTLVTRYYCYNLLSCVVCRYLFWNSRNFRDILFCRFSQMLFLLVALNNLQWQRSIQDLTNTARDLSQRIIFTH